MVKYNLVNCGAVHCSRVQLNVVKCGVQQFSEMCCSKLVVKCCEAQSGEEYLNTVHCVTR